MLIFLQHLIIPKYYNSIHPIFINGIPPLTLTILPISSIFSLKLDSVCQESIGVLMKIIVISVLSINIHLTRIRFVKIVLLWKAFRNVMEVIKHLLSQDIGGVINFLIIYLIVHNSLNSAFLLLVMILIWLTCKVIICVEKDILELYVKDVIFMVGFGIRVLFLPVQKIVLNVLGSLINIIL
jgi:hypothetical protein